MTNGLLRSALVPAFALLALVSSETLAQAGGSGGDIRKVDFKNYSYRTACFDSPVRARNGRYERGGAEMSVKRVVYGDLTGDKVEEAVVVTVCSAGGSSANTEGAVYAMQGGRTVALTQLEAGDRAYGGIHGVRVADGLLYVERFVPEGPDGPSCCPKYVETTGYRLQGKRLQQTGRKQRRDAVEGKDY